MALSLTEIGSDGSSASWLGTKTFNPRGTSIPWLSYPDVAAPIIDPVTGEWDGNDRNAYDHGRNQDTDPLNADGVTRQLFSPFVWWYT